MKFYIAPLFFLIAPISILWAQEYEVSGNVKDSNNTAIAYANVLLLQPSDSSIVSGTATDDNGFFKFGNVSPNSYLITASYIGNTSGHAPIEVFMDTGVGTIVLDEVVQALDEVVVSSKSPTLERKADRLVFNIENTSLSESDIWDALKLTPGIFTINDRLTFKGEGGVQVMINDKKVNLPQEDIINLLSGTSAGSVQAIEIITTPPAKYDSEGGTLINIKMKKNLISGYNGAIFNQYKQGIFPKHTLGTSHYFKGKKLELSFNYSFGVGKSITRYTDIINFIENNAITEVWTSDLDKTVQDNKHNASIFLDYTLDNKNTVSITSITSAMPKYKRMDDSETIITDPNGTLLSSFVTANNSDADRMNSSLYMDFAHKFNEKGAKLLLNSHYTYYNYDREQNLATDFLDSNGNITGKNDFITTNEQRTDLYSFQADFESPIATSARLETGLKYAKTDSKSNIEQEGFDPDQPGIDPTEDGVFEYDENIYAAYANYSSEWEKWNLNTGIRAEFTETEGNFSFGDTPIKNDYLEFFPTFSLQFTPNKKNSFEASYYRRITRPKYSDINPFLSFQSNNSVVEGNQNLQPSFKNLLTLSYTLDKSYTFEVYYRYHKGRQASLIFQDNENRLLRFINANVEREMSYGLDFIVNKEVTRFWDTYLLSSYFYRAERFTDIQSGIKIDNRLWTLYLEANNSFTFLKDKSLFADVSFAYVSPIILGNSRQEDYKEWEISLKKTLWNKKGVINMGLSDVFKQFSLFNSRKFGDQNNTSLYRPEGRIFTFGFRYKFGNLKIADNQKSKDVQETKRL